MGRFLPGRGTKSRLVSVNRVQYEYELSVAFFLHDADTERKVGLRVDVQFYVETKLQKYETIV
jgi:hypothetical protein